MSANDKTGVETLFALAATAIALGFWIRWRERAPIKWPQAKGVIVTSTTDWRNTSRGGREVFPVIEYEFSYQGQKFNSSHWRFGNYSEGSEDSAKAVIVRYPVGFPVAVYVNPRNPAKSVLETATSTLSWVPFVFGLFLIALAVLVVLVDLSR